MFTLDFFASNNLLEIYTYKKCEAATTSLLKSYHIFIGVNTA